VEVASFQPVGIEAVFDGRGVVLFFHCFSGAWLRTANAILFMDISIIKGA
jgi:hypothetical protein